MTKHYDTYDLANNVSHQVEVKRDEVSGKIVIFIDVNKDSLEIPQFYSRQFVRQTFYLGGVDLSGIQTKHWYLRERDFVFYEGCLEDANTNVNGLKLLDLAWKNNTMVVAKADGLVRGCRIMSKGYRPITFPEPDSFIKVIAPNNSTATYRFKFRTYVGEGILLSQRRTQNGAKISISFVPRGRIKLKVEFVSGSRSVTLCAGSDLNDGMWHTVAVNISIQRVRLQVDDELISQSHSSHGRFVSGSEVYVGASQRGFVGCIRDLLVQGHQVNISTVYRSKVKEDKCNLVDRCLQNPCKNGGKCVQQWNFTSCDCSRTSFKGPKCESPAFFMQSCADWWAAGKTANSYYRINPQHSKPFTVYCNMSNKNGPSTVILHTRTNKVISVESDIKGNYYQHDISYENYNEHNIKDLIASSTHCRQYLQYKCYNSVLFDSPRAFNISGRGARWVSRDGKVQDYWSGASPGSKQCACGVNRTCKVRTKACNCDIVDNKWHIDDGYLTDPRSLPVKRLLFSVDGTSRKSYFVLGSLECFGSTTQRPTTFPPPEIVTNNTHTAIPSKPNEPETNVSSTSSFMATTLKDPNTIKVSSKVVKLFTPKSTTKTTEDASSTEQHLTTPDTIIVIERPRKYITIQENPNQQLVLILLSVILAIFVISIAVLILKQSLLSPCKCLKKRFYHDENHMDTIELAAPDLLVAEPEILQFQTSPYPVRNMDCDIGLHDCHDRPSPEVYSDAETDRLDISNESSTWNSENADTEKKEIEKIEDYKDVDLGLIDVVPFPASKQLSTEQQIIRLKEVIFDVLAAADVKVTHSDKNDNTTTHPIKQYKVLPQSKPEFGQALINGENGQEDILESDSEGTQTISGTSSEIEVASEERSTPGYNTSSREINNVRVYLDTANEIVPGCRNSDRLCNLNRYSSDPSENYLSLDVNTLEDNASRQPISRGELTRIESQYDAPNSPRSNPSYVHREQEPFLNEKRKNGTSQNQDKRRHSPRHRRTFFRQKSEEEALLSSTSIGHGINGLKQNLTNDFSESKRRHHISIAKVFCQQQEQLSNASKIQADTQPTDIKKAFARAPLKQPHSQKYETEL